MRTSDLLAIVPLWFVLACGGAAPAPVASPASPAGAAPTAPAAAPAPADGLAHFGPFTAMVPAGFTTKAIGPGRALIMNGDLGVYLGVSTFDTGDIADRATCVATTSAVADGFVSGISGHKVEVKQLDAGDEPDRGCWYMGEYGPRQVVVVSLRGIGDAIAMAICVPDGAGDGNAQGKLCAEITASIARSEPR